METTLINSYVTVKAIKASEKLAKKYGNKLPLTNLPKEERKKVIKAVLTQPLTVFPPRALELSIAAINNRLQSGLQASFVLAFSNLNTVQNLVDYYMSGKKIICTLSSEKLAAQWAKEIGTTVKLLLKAKLDSSFITRPMAITLCEQAEKLTNRSILQDSEAPLRYLDNNNITYGDIIDYFTVGNDKVHGLRQQLYGEHYVDELQDLRNLIRKTYAKNCYDEFSPEFAQTIVKTHAVEGSWDGPIFWTEAELGVQLPYAFDHLGDKTVKELMDAFVIAYKQQERRKAETI